MRPKKTSCKAPEISAKTMAFSFVLNAAKMTEIIIQVLKSVPLILNS